MPGAARVGLALSMSLVLFSTSSFAQKVLEVKGFKVADYFGPPHETQMKSLLEGARARPQPGGLTLVTEARLHTWRETGEPEMVVDTPECLHDNNHRTVSSAGPLHARAADSKFSIEGEGFLWQQTNSSLFISNSVHSVVHPDLLASSTTSAKPGDSTNAIDILSDAFAYGANTGVATYRGSVRVAGTNLDLASGSLTFKMPTKDRQLQSITAEQDVVVDYGAVHATGDNAVYTVDTGLVRVTGHPTWRAEQREGRGEELVIDRTNRIFRAIGLAHLKMPVQGAGTGGFLSLAGPAPSEKAPTTNRFVEMDSADYELRTNSAVFRGDVRVRELEGEDVVGKMSCGRMDLAFSGTNQLDRMVAQCASPTELVVIEQGDRRLTGGRAVYSGTNTQMELTETPAWQAGTRSGKGNRILVNTAANEMVVRGNAAMRLPASELGRPGVPAPGEGALSKSASNQFADLFSEEYRLRSDTAFFRGGVYISHPQMNWTCETLRVQLPQAGGKIDRILAEKAVVFDLADEQGRKVHGKGDNALYTYSAVGLETNETMRLTGTPALLETTNGIVQNALIVLDLQKNKLSAPGRYRIHGKAPAAGTNKFRLPTDRAAK